MIESPYMVKPGKKFQLSDIDPDDTGKFKDRHDAHAVASENLARLADLQAKLYAESKHSLLIILQAMDAAGKDGSIKYVFSGVNPQGCEVHSFKKPSHLEMAHDFLWRHHVATPAYGMIGIHNRSHYEALLVERVREIMPKKRWEKRFDHVNNFERMLVDEGTTILKFYLHISKDVQKERLESRLHNSKKNWKFNPADLEERKLWPKYQAAYQDVLEKCSTDWAPWYVVPANKKWYRNWVLSDIILRAMKKMAPKFPEPIEDIDQYHVE